MGSVFRFLADPTQQSEVLSWFKALPSPPDETLCPLGSSLHFANAGSIARNPDGSVDPKSSPLVSVFLPRVRFGVLWTVGEVHFLATPSQQFPLLQKVRANFAKWFGVLDCVYSQHSAESPFAYYLEGSVRNFETPIRAFSSGLDALRSGRYFVSEGDSEALLAKLSQKLRLRGVQCNGP